jgi:hypothetical protein
MARHSATDLTERRTKPLRSWVTAEEKKRLEAAAEHAGAGLSDYIRQLCLRRQGTGPVVAGSRRNPAAKALADELRAIGINLNQLTRLANQTGEVPRDRELSVTIDLLKVTMRKVITL